MSKNGFGEWLKTTRTVRGLSVRGLAQTAGVGRSTLSDWETGKSLPRLPELEIVFDALQVSPSERQDILRGMETPRALRQSQGETALFCPEFVERAGLLPHGGDLLKAMRFRKRWTLQAAARRIGVRQTTLGRWERGEHFPDGERLQTVCFIYRASEAEVVALTCGRYSLDQDTAETLPFDALEARFRSELEPIELAAEIHPGSELRYLSMEAALYPYALRNEKARLLLSEVYAHHANYLRNWRITSDVYAFRSLELLPSANRLPAFAALAIVSVSDVLIHRHDKGQRSAKAWMTGWLKRDFPPLAMSWMLRKFAGLLKIQGDFDGARAQLYRAEALPWHENSAFDLIEIRRYHAMTLLAAGDAGRGLDYLPDMTDPYPPNRVRDALTRAEGFLALNLPVEAHGWLTAAYADIAAYGLSHWQADADFFARRL